MEWVKVTDRLPPDDVAVVLGWEKEPGRWAQWREVWYSRCGWASDFAFCGVTHWAIPTGPSTPSNALAQADAACGVSPGAMGSAEPSHQTDFLKG